MARPGAILPVAANPGPWPYTNTSLIYQWYKNGTAVAGATTSALVLPMALQGDNGAQVYCAVRALGYVDPIGNPRWTNSSRATLTVVATAPHLLYAAIYTNVNPVNFGNPPVTYVDLAFDLPMDPVAAGITAHYALSGGLIITSATINTNDYKSVELAVVGTPAFPCTVMVNGLGALGGGLSIPANSTAAVTPNVELTCLDIGSPGVDPAVPPLCTSTALTLTRSSAKAATSGTLLTASTSSVKP